MNVMMIVISYDVCYHKLHMLDFYPPSDKILLRS